MSNICIDSNELNLRTKKKNAIIFILYLLCKLFGLITPTFYVCLVTKISCVGYLKIDLIKIFPIGTYLIIYIYCLNV